MAAIPGNQGQGSSEAQGVGSTFLPYGSSPNQLPSAQAVQQELTQLRYEIQFINNLLITISANLNALGTNLSQQITNQQIATQNQANELLLLLIDIAADAEEQNQHIEGELGRLRNLIDERLAHFQLSHDRHLGVVQHNQNSAEQIARSIEQNTKAMYRVLALLTWKQILFSHFVYWIRVCLQKLRSLCWGLLRPICAIVRWCIEWDVARLESFARPGHILGGRRVRPYVLRLIDLLNSSAAVGRPLVIELGSFVLLLLVMIYVVALVGGFIGDALATIDTTRWAMEYTGLYGKAYRDSAILAMRPPSIVSSVGADAWTAQLGQLAESGQISSTAHDTSTTLSNTASSKLLYQEPHGEEFQSDIKTAGLWDKYTKPVPRQQQANTNSVEHSDNEDKDFFTNLGGLLALAVDAAHEVARTVGLSARMNEAALEQGVLETENVKEREAATENAVKNVKFLRELMDDFASMIKDFVGEAAA